MVWLIELLGPNGISIVQSSPECFNIQAEIINIHIFGIFYLKNYQAPVPFFLDRLDKTEECYQIHVSSLPKTQTNYKL